VTSSCAARLASAVRVALLPAATLIACASGPTASVPKAPLPRPTPVDSQLTSLSLVWRASPIPHQGARQTVRRFFDSVAREAGPQLESLFAEDALFHRPDQPATPAVIAWLRRLSAGDYTLTALSTAVPVHLLDHASSRRLAAYRTLHLQPQAGEVLAIVSLPATSGQTPALWGSEMQLVLTPRGGQWQIREVWEDYTSR
jgi:ketosteroid isomerase-like protein